MVPYILLFAYYCPVFGYYLLVKNKQANVLHFPLPASLPPNFPTKTNKQKTTTKPTQGERSTLTDGLKL